jgi:hypothetical protein
MGGQAFLQEFFQLIGLCGIERPRNSGMPETLHRMRHFTLIVAECEEKIVPKSASLIDLTDKMFNRTLQQSFSRQNALELKSEIRISKFETISKLEFLKF